jgi:cell division septum initiation protein DivIVA
LSNFSKFVDAIENSYEEYEERNRLANRNVEVSSKELTHALHSVETLNLNINAMLDSLRQALLFFDEKGICTPLLFKSLFRYF